MTHHHVSPCIYNEATYIQRSDLDQLIGDLLDMVSTVICYTPIIAWPSLRHKLPHKI